MKLKHFTVTKRYHASRWQNSMLKTLLVIPFEVGDVPIFGVGVLLAVWLVFSAGLLVYLVRKQGWNADTLGYLPVLAIVAAVLVVLPRVFSDEYGGVPIHGYGVMLLLGVVSGVGLAAHRAQRMGLAADVILGLAFWMFICGIIGARLFHVVEYRSQYQTLWDVLNVPQGGLVVYGSLIGAALAFLGYTVKHQLPALALADLIAPSLVIGLALGRVGCLMNGCCFGGPCDLPWAVTFPAGSPVYGSQIADGTLWGIVLGEETESGRRTIARIVADSPAAAAELQVGDEIVAMQAVSPTADVAGVAVPSLAIVTSDRRNITLPAMAAPRRSQPVHPTQIYSAVNAALLCLLLIAVYPYRRRDGEVIALLLTIYPISRFLLEVIRTDESAVVGTGLSISQNVSVWILLGVAALWFFVLRRPRGSELPVQAEPGLT